MVYRKGELSAAQIHRQWPHQLALPDLADNTARYQRHKDMESFCSVNRIDRAPRGHSFCEGDIWHQVHCFATREQAELFKERFGGEWFDPRQRGRGHAWAKRKGG